MFSIYGYIIMYLGISYFLAETAHLLIYPSTRKDTSMPKLIDKTSTKSPIQDLDRLSRSIKEKLRSKDVQDSLDSRENEILHGTWVLEQQLLSYIREGNEEGVRHLFLELSKQDTLTAGVLAATPLRQEKNLFIGFVALVGKTAAIEGGMDVEAAYRLVDIYTQECEESTQVEELYALRYYMILDFTDRVRQAQLPKGISPEMGKALHYINEHIYEAILIDDIADHLQISRSSLTKKFRKDLGRSIGEYITETKIKEAQRLLLYSDMTISEIAEYLAYCNQPHFQMVFKKQTGMTPLEFRQMGTGVNGRLGTNGRPVSFSDPS